MWQAMFPVTGGWCHCRAAAATVCTHQGGKRLCEGCFWRREEESQYRCPASLEPRWEQICSSLHVPLQLLFWSVILPPHLACTDIVHKSYILYKFSILRHSLLLAPGETNELNDQNYSSACVYFVFLRYFDPGWAHIRPGQLHSPQPGDHSVPPGPGKPPGPAFGAPASLRHLPALRSRRPAVVWFSYLLRCCSRHGALLHCAGTSLPKILQPLWLLWWVCV